MDISIARERIRLAPSEGVRWLARPLSMHGHSMPYLFLDGYFASFGCDLALVSTFKCLCHALLARAVFTLACALTKTQFKAMTPNNLMV